MSQLIVGLVLLVQKIQRLACLLVIHGLCRLAADHVQRGTPWSCYFYVSGTTFRPCTCLRLSYYLQRSMLHNLTRQLSSCKLILHVLGRGLYNLNVWPLLVILCHIVGLTLVHRLDWLYVLHALGLVIVNDLIHVLHLLRVQTACIWVVSMLIVYQIESIRATNVSSLQSRLHWISSVVDIRPQVLLRNLLGF